MARKMAMVFGIVFILVGLLGFISNPIVGEGAMFATNTAHDVVHLLFGVILFMASRGTGAKAAMWLRVIGIVYLLIALLGFFMTSEDGMLFGLIENNAADNWLHVVLAAILLWGSMSKSNSTMPTAGGMAQ